MMQKKGIVWSALPWSWPVVSGRTPCSESITGNSILESAKCISLCQLQTSNGKVERDEKGSMAGWCGWAQQTFHQPLCPRHTARLLFQPACLYAWLYDGLSHWKVRESKAFPIQVWSLSPTITTTTTACIPPRTSLSSLDLMSMNSTILDSTLETEESQGGKD